MLRSLPRKGVPCTSTGWGRSLACALLLCLLPVRTFGRDRPCISPQDASKYLNKDICISAHVYDVVQVGDGTRFLDVCPPETADEQCRFTLMTTWEDRDQVGELTEYRDMNIRVRGIVRPMQGRSGILISHARQFHGGPPRFKPNPKLLRGFSGDQPRPPLNDPNLRTQGGHRGFMNGKDREVAH